METKKKEQNTKAEAETFAATVKGMNRDDQLKPFCREEMDAHHRRHRHRHHHRRSNRPI